MAEQRLADAQDGASDGVTEEGPAAKVLHWAAEWYPLAEATMERVLYVPVILTAIAVSLVVVERFAPLRTPKQALFGRLIINLSPVTISCARLRAT